jgi:structural maintenance of chromosome 2
LLALSLILALLLFKPAPMYILDEVDAALDLSHTQNIGQMIRTHFAKSQFIVVSLKEGMFNNASVIYRTKFVDGVSTVRRTIGNGGKTNRNRRAAEQGDDGENQRSSANNQRSTSSSSASSSAAVDKQSRVRPSNAAPLR